VIVHHGGQPKPPQPISAGRHFLFWVRGLPRREEQIMNYYRAQIREKAKNGRWQTHFLEMEADTAQKVADQIRKDRPEEPERWYIDRIYKVEYDWE